MTRAFAGIRVVDLTHVLAGPFATYQLAVLGADVIKIEHPERPDQVRETGTDPALGRALMGTNYLSQGSNKRSLTLDLSQLAGSAVLARLIATADVFVENYRAGALEAVRVARNIRVLSIASLLGEAIGRTATEESVSSLFD